MPYARNSELPSGVRNALPDAAQTIYRHAYNSEHKRGLPEKTCHEAAWGAVRNAGWRRGEGGKWVKKAQAPDPPKPADRDAAGMMTVKVAKVVPDQRIVYGWASVVAKGGLPVVDLQGHVITQDEIEKALHDYVQHYRMAGEMHERIMDGDAGLVAGFPVTDETVPILEEAIREGMRGALVGLRFDPEAFEKVKSGECRAFSIGGKAILEDMEEAA